ncbi:unnamed protein product [Trichogramma brassicae]|uniref:Uncharacterized protein n=1 Tax=Trichogramma brassicae TaxID=86971 RepID=A0A6H5IAJ0_9HYME|nr:unnamed protein product [Trichogramma brassicae]
MDCLLMNDLYVDRPVNETTLIDIMILIGYEDATKKDEKDMVLPRRVTPIHVLGQQDRKLGRTNIQNITNIPKLFKIYNRFDVNYTDEDGFTHFHAASMYGCYYTVQKFLNHGQDPNCIEQGTRYTPLHYSVTYGNPEVTELLLRRGANPNLAAVDGSTPLHIICSSSIFDVKSAKMLIQMSDKKFQPVQVDARDASAKPLAEPFRSGLPSSDITSASTLWCPTILLCNVSRAVVGSVVSVLASETIGRSRSLGFKSWRGQSDFSDCHSAG